MILSVTTVMVFSVALRFLHKPVTIYSFGSVTSREGGTMKRDRAGRVKRLTTCAWCGSPFYTSRLTLAKFDSVKCRVAHHRYMKFNRVPMWQNDTQSKKMTFKINGKEIYK